MQWQRRVELGIAQQRKGEVWHSSVERGIAMAYWIFDKCPATRREAKFSNGLVALGDVQQWQCTVELRTATGKLSPVMQRKGEVK